MVLFDTEVFGRRPGTGDDGCAASVSDCQLEDRVDVESIALLMARQVEGATTLAMQPLYLELQCSLQFEQLSLRCV